MRADFIHGKIRLIIEDWDFDERIEVEHVLSTSTARRLSKELARAADAAQPTVQADAASCPLYVDYEKSCQALKDRDAELNRTA